MVGLYIMSLYKYSIIMITLCHHCVDQNPTELEIKKHNNYQD